MRKTRRRLYRAAAGLGWLLAVVGGPVRLITRVIFVSLLKGFTGALRGILR